MKYSLFRVRFLGRNLGILKEREDLTAQGVGYTQHEGARSQRVDSTGEETMKMLIDGKFVDASEGTVIDVFNPYTGALIDQVPGAGKGDVDRAVQAARAGSGVMAAMPAHARAALLEGLAEKIDRNREELAVLLVKENGKTITHTRYEINTTVNLYRGFAEEAKRMFGHTIPMDTLPGAGCEDMFAFTVRHPVGVVVGIAPFNYPVELFAHKLGPAIAAGNSFIGKLPSECPLTLLKLGEYMQEVGFPAQSVQLLTGRGADMGEYLISREGVDYVSFTGSVSSGIGIAGICSRRLARYNLELGGSDPLVVWRDADLDLSVDRIAAGRFMSGAGQICCAVKRVIVHRDVHDKLVKKLIERSRTIIHGDPMDERTELGPMIHKQAAAKVKDQVDRSIEGGAVCVLGNGIVEGNIFLPTILTDVTPYMPVMKEEVFGPVIPIYAVHTLEEAIAVANGTGFGLQSAIMTENITDAMRFALAVEAGGVVINSCGAFRPGNVPFGGFKKSGVGRESLMTSIEEMTEEKTVVISGVSTGRGI
jgi:acyl-CoA reductase-like NAD-dependent aldehyde dehydrogenase